MAVVRPWELLLRQSRNPYKPPKTASDSSPINEVEPQEKLTVWLQLKRVCIGVAGLVATLWSAYTTYKVLTEQGSQHYWLLILTTAAFFLGFWMIRIAVRGRSQEVRDVLF